MATSDTDTTSHNLVASNSATTNIGEPPSRATIADDAITTVNKPSNTSSLNTNVDATVKLVSSTKGSDPSVDNQRTEPTSNTRIRQNMDDTRRRVSPSRPSNNSTTATQNLESVDVSQFNTLGRPRSSQSKSVTTLSS